MSIKSTVDVHHELDTDGKTIVRVNREYQSSRQACVHMSNPSAEAIIASLDAAYIEGRASAFSDIRNLLR